MTEQISNKELADNLRAMLNLYLLRGFEQSAIRTAAERLAAMPDANAKILFSSNTDVFQPYDTLEDALQEAWEKESLDLYTVYEGRIDAGGVFVEKIRPRVFREIREAELFEFDNFNEITAAITQPQQPAPDNATVEYYLQNDVGFVFSAYRYGNEIGVMGGAHRNGDTFLQLTLTAGAALNLSKAIADGLNAMVGSYETALIKNNLYDKETIKRYIYEYYYYRDHEHLEYLGQEAVGEEFDRWWDDEGKFLLGNVQQQSAEGGE